MKKLNIRRLVVSTNRGTVYHSWRKTYNINKFGLFYIIEDEELVTGIETGSHYFLYRGKVVGSFDAICDIINGLLLEKVREIKINKILNEL